MVNSPSAVGDAHAALAAGPPPRVRDGLVSDQKSLFLGPGERPGFARIFLQRVMPS